MLMDKEKLYRSIQESDIPRTESDILLRRLKIASHEGVASVVRDFDYQIEIHRAKTLKSHRHRLPGLIRRDYFQNKRVDFINFK